MCKRCPFTMQKVPFYNVKERLSKVECDFPLHNSLINTFCEEECLSCIWLYTVSIYPNSDSSIGIL